MATAGQSFIEKYAKGKATQKEATKAFQDIQRKAGVSESELTRQTERRSSRSSRKSRKQSIDAKIVAEKKAKRQAEIKEQQKEKALKDKAESERIKQEKLRKIIEERNRLKALTEERLRIQRERQRLISSGARVKVREFINVDTGEKEKHTTIGDTRGGTRIFEVENLKTGEKMIRTWEQKPGQKTRQTGGIIIGATPERIEIKDDAATIASKFEIKPSERAGYNLVKAPNGQIFRVKKTGTSIVGANLAGNKLTFKDGVIIAVDDKSTGVREEFIPSPTVRAVESKGSFIKGFQKVAISKKFQPKEIRSEQDKKEKVWKDILNKMGKGEKLNQTDISNYKEISEFTPEKLIDKDVARFAQITGGVVGTVVAPIPGAIIWAMGDTFESVRKSAGDGKKITRKEFGKIVLDSATKGAIMGFGMKVLGGVANIASKRVILGGALRTIEKNAIRSALNHGGILIKLVGRSGKNFISTYFMKDMLGNVFDVTNDVKSGNFNNAIRKAIETGGSIGGYIGGSAIGKATTRGAIFAVGKLKATVPEFAQKKTQLDVMAKQLLSEGKIVLSRRGVYESGKGLSPRKDAWLDSRVKNPTKSVFWRFDKTLSPKDEAISPLPLFTKSKTGYLKMFKTNWNKNRGMSTLKRYIKTTAETPLVEDVLIRRVVKLKDIKDLNLRRQVIKEYATTGKLSKVTQNKVLKNPKFGISDKNREFGFHDENEFVTRTGFKFKGRKDISWTYDPTLGEYVPVVQDLKDAGRIKNFLSVLNKKKIITRTDAKFIADNYAIKTQFKASSILPNKHSYTHMKQVENNIVKLMNKYPQYNSYWKKRYGSVAKARDALKQAMWHDIGKGESASEAFGTAHGEKVWRVWKAGLLPKDIKLTRPVAKAIKKHETLDPRKLWYKVQNKVKLISPEEKIVATADRLDLVRFGIKVDPKRLPLSDALTRLNIKQKDIKFPSSFNQIITKIKLDKGVTKADLKKIMAYFKANVGVKAKALTYKTSKWKGYTSTKYKDSYKAGWLAGNRQGLKAPTNYNPKYEGVQSAYIEGYKSGYNGRYGIKYKTGEYKKATPRKRAVPKRPTKRPTPRTPGRPTPRTPGRPTKRPPKRPPVRAPKRPTKRPPKRPRVPRVPTIKTPPKPPVVLTIPKGFKRKTLSKSQPVYYVVIRRGGKLVKLSPKPMILSDARDYGAYRNDRGLSRSFWFEPIGNSKNVVGLPNSIRGYYSKISNKLRPYKINRGVKLGIRNGYIEKSKYVGDTISEQRALQAARRKAPKKLIKKKPVKKQSKRKPQPQKRKKATVKRKKTPVKRKVTSKKTQTKKRKKKK